MESEKIKINSLLWTKDLETWTDIKSKAVPLLEKIRQLFI